MDLLNKRKLEQLEKENAELKKKIERKDYERLVVEEKLKDRDVEVAMYRTSDCISGGYCVACEHGVWDEERRAYVCIKKPLCKSFRKKGEQL